MYNLEVAIYTTGRAANFCLDMYTTDVISIFWPGQKTCGNIEPVGKFLGDFFFLQTEK